MKQDSEQIVEKTWKRFGRWVFHKREERGWTQELCAQRADMLRQQWQRIEKGASTKRVTVIRVAQALDADIDEALKMAGFIPSATTSETDSIEEALKNAFFFDQKGLSAEDIEKIRPLLQVVDREVDRLKKDEEKK